MPSLRAIRPPATGCLRLALALLLFGMQAVALAAPSRYVLDPVHTRVVFSIDHAGLSRAVGTVSGSTGTLLFDPADWSSARLEAQVPLQRIDLGDARWNRATLAPGLLDATRHPVASFVSSAVQGIDARRARVTGVLTLRGVAREVTLDVTLNAVKRHPLPPFRRSAGFSATTVISRSAFGITSWRSLIGDSVELRFEVEAVRDGAATVAGATPARGPTDANGSAEPESAPPPGADETSDRALQAELDALLDAELEADDKARDPADGDVAPPPPPHGDDIP